MTIETGQTVTSLEHLAYETGLTVQNVRTALKNLEKTGEINKQSTNKYTLITVENYAFYQGKEDESTSELTTNQQTTNKQLTTNKKNKNEKNIEISKISNSKEGAFQRPTLQEVTEYIKEKGYHVDPVQFVAFYDSNGWKVGRNKMKSWKSALVTWEKRRRNDRTNKSVEEGTVESYDDVLFR